MTTAIHIIIGSQMGAAEYVADELVAALDQQNITVTSHEQPQYAQIPQQDAIWLICTSTHGAGELPDNIQDFVSQLKQNKPDLGQIRFGVISLGDSSYDTFCQAGIDITALLQQLGARLTGEILQIDAQDADLPEDFALQWLPDWLNTLK